MAKNKNNKPDTLGQQPKQRLKLRPTGQYGKEYKRVVQSEKFDLVEFFDVLYLLMSQESLPAKYNDHPLEGTWKGWRECHVCNDCLLIYKVKDNELQVARIGTHHELFGK